MAKKKSEELETIVENEPVVINEADILSEEEVNEAEVINVEASEVIIENSSGDEKTEEPSVPAPTTDKALKVQIAFTDKYDNTKHYKVGDLLENLSEERYNELINDSRKLVCKAY